jgi:hypothetical protein
MSLTRLAGANAVATDEPLMLGDAFGSHPWQEHMS